MATMLLHLWQSTLFILVIACAARLMSNAPARLLGALYWIGLVKLFLPLPWLAAVPRVLLAGLARDPAAAGAGVTTEWSAISVVMYPAILEPRSGLLQPGAQLALAVAWIVGVCGFLVRGLLAVRSHGLERPLESVPAPLCDTLLAALRGTGLAADRVRVSDRAATPFVRGLVSPVVVVPAHVLAALDDDELRPVLIHEAEHARRRDPLRLAILYVARAVFFFYPPVWWLARKIHETTEMACDEAVVRAGQSPDVYCRSLAHTLKLGLDRMPAVTPAGALGHHPSLLLRRLERIRSGRRFEAMLSHRTTLAVALALALALSVLPSGPTGTLQAGEQSQANLQQLAEADLEVQLRFERRTLSSIFEALQAVSRTEFRLAGSLGSELADIDAERVPLFMVLERLGKTAGLEYAVLGPRAVEVRKAPGAEVSVPKLISKVQPVYPEDARIARRGGRVVLQALIDRAGLVQEATVLRSEPADGAEFVASAIEAVRQWRYEPALRNGEPVDTYFTINVEFSIETEPRESRPRSPAQPVSDPV